jgi:2-polyprenyl-3-methyl-5-hydroxy-6-metoxy-1,4-benzoquinol methylase
MVHANEQLRYYENPDNDYDGRTGTVNRAPTRAFKRKSVVIRKAISGEHHSQVLEIGAGSGLLSCFAVKMLSFDNYIVSDLSKNMLERAKKLLNESEVSTKSVSFEVIDLYEVSKSSKKFDLILGSDIIHHLSDPVSVLRDLRETMNPGGKLVILETNIRNPLSWPNIIGREHEMRAVMNTRENLLDWLLESGWSNASVSPAPAFTPAGPRWAHPVLGAIDQIAVQIPKIKQISALLTLYGEA